MTKKRGLETLTLELLRKCPNACQHCSTSSSPKANDFIPFQSVIKLIDDALELGLKRVILSGGEPLLYYSLMELLDYLKSKKIEIVIYTSGSIVDLDDNPISVPFDLIKKINDIGIVRYNLSLHSSISENHDKFMETNGSWERAVNFIDNCNKVNEEVHIHTVLSNYNYDNFIELGTFLSAKNIKTLRVLKLVPQGRAKINFNSLNPSDINNEIFWGQVKNLKESNLINVKLGAHLYSLSNNTEYECSLNSDKMTISPDGTFSVCAAFKGLSQQLNSPNFKTTSINNALESNWRENIDNFKNEFRHSCPAQELYNKIISQKKRTI
jgi:MoaA/NifB/PqqE/SkfB family radical SAM enzyme